MNIKTPLKIKPLTMLMTIISLTLFRGLDFETPESSIFFSISRPQRILHPTQHLQHSRFTSSPPKKLPHLSGNINHGTHKAAAGLWQNTMRQLRTTKATSSLEATKMFRPPATLVVGFFLPRKFTNIPPLKGTSSKGHVHILSINFQKGMLCCQGGEFR